MYGTQEKYKNMPGISKYDTMPNYCALVVSILCNKTINESLGIFELNPYDRENRNKNRRIIK